MSDSACLHLTLLGAPHIQLPGGVAAELHSAKAQALLYYLAVTARAHTRASVDPSRTI